MSEKKSVEFDLGALLHELPLEEVRELVEGHPGFFGQLVDWQLRPLLLKIGWELTGMNFRRKPDEWLMVLKFVCEEAPYVVFVSSLSPRGCMLSLLGKLARGDCPTYLDKYA